MSFVDGMIIFTAKCKVAEHQNTFGAASDMC